jgi:pimeloyl-ACP methyl ester carboxylesterase
MKLIKRIALILLGLIILAGAGFFAWTRLARYPATPQAAALITPDVHTDQGWYVFKPAHPANTGLIVYPGGLVDPAAYAPLARDIAARGITVVIVPMPLDLAVLGINNADAVIAAYPDVAHWALAGHSLGGSMAAQYIAGHASNLGKIDGLAFWASYAPNGVDLSGLPLKVVSIYGSRDGVLQRDPSGKPSLHGLPPDVKLVVIEGGNHAGFGSYGAQNGDNPAALSPDQQQQIAADQTVQVIGR